MKLVATLSAALCSLVIAQSAVAQTQAEPQPQPKYKPFVMACSDDKPSIGFVVRELTEAPDTIVTELFLFQGAQYIPVDSFPRANDLAALTKRAALLSQLPTYLRIEWPRTQCTDKGPFMISCLGETAKTNYEGVAVKGLKMQTVLAAEATTEDQNYSVRVNLSLNVNGEDVLVPLYFPAEQCTPLGTF